MATSPTARMDRSLDVPGVGAPRRVFQLSGPQPLRQRLTEWHGGVGRVVAVCLSLKTREGLLGLPTRDAIGAFDGLAQITVARVTGSCPAYTRTCSEPPRVRMLPLLRGSPVPSALAMRAE